MFVVHPQAAHMLSPRMPAEFVDKLWILSELRACNAPPQTPCRMYAPGFLPTMKLQLSQLP